MRICSSRVKEMNQKEICQIETSDERGGSVFAALYARTSSPNQRFNYSIKEQVDRCWKYCEDRGWTVTNAFIDECESGGTIERPKFQLMLEKAKAMKFQVIVFWKLDRFCRSLVDLVNVEKSLRQWHIGLCSATEFIDTTSSVGRFNYRNLASMAELERELIGERARMGLHALARQHRWPNPHPPLGYDVSESGCLRINKDEADLIQKILRMYLNEKSMPQVAFRLNEEGILTKKGGRWNARAVRDILANEVYAGTYSVAGVMDHIEECRIVDDDLFKKVNEIRIRYRDGESRRPPMPIDRKGKKIQKLFGRYMEILKVMESPETVQKSQAV